MYMPGRLRTASSPLRTWICPALYFCSSSPPLFVAMSHLEKTARINAENVVGFNLGKVLGKTAVCNRLDDRQVFGKKGFTRRGHSPYSSLASSHRIRRTGVRSGFELSDRSSSGSSSDN